MSSVFTKDNKRKLVPETKLNQMCQSSKTFSKNFNGNFNILSSFRQEYKITSMIAYLNINQRRSYK